MNTGTPEDKKYFILFLRELRETFDFKAREEGRDRLLLALTAGVDEDIIDTGKLILRAV